MLHRPSLSDRLLSVRPLSVHHFQRSSSPNPLGQSKPNFIWSLNGMGERKFIHGVTWPRWPPHPYSMVKTLQKSGGSRPTAAVLCPWARHFTPRKYWLITQEAMAPSRHDWKIVDWDVKPQHNQPTFKNRLLRNQRANDLVAWYVAFGPWAHHSLFKWWP